MEGQSRVKKRARRSTTTTTPTYAALALLERRVHTGRDDARAGDDLSREVAVAAEDEVSGQLANGDHVGRLLQLDRLLVDKGALVVHDDVGVEWAVFGLAGRGGAVGRRQREVRTMAPREEAREARSRDARNALARQLEAGKATLDLLRRDVAARLAREVKAYGARREDRGADDDAG